MKINYQVEDLADTLQLMLERGLISIYDYVDVLEKNGKLPF